MGNFNTSHLYSDEFELIEGHGINGLHIRRHYASFNMHALLQPVMNMFFNNITSTHYEFRNNLKNCKLEK